MKKIYYDVYAQKAFTKEALIKVFQNIIDSIENESLLKGNANFPPFKRVKLWIKEYNILEAEDIKIFKENQIIHNTKEG